MATLSLLSADLPVSVIGYYAPLVMLGDRCAFGRTYACGGIVCEATLPSGREVGSVKASVRTSLEWSQPRGSFVHKTRCAVELRCECFPEAGGWKLVFATKVGKQERSSRIILMIRRRRRRTGEGAGSGSCPGKGFPGGDCKCTPAPRLYRCKVHSESEK